MLTKVQCPKIPKSERNLSLTWHQMVFLNWSLATINSVVAFRTTPYYCMLIIELYKNISRTDVMTFRENNLRHYVFYTVKNDVQMTSLR